jgi:hypothetical protein
VLLDALARDNIPETRLEPIEPDRDLPGGLVARGARPMTKRKT